MEYSLFSIAPIVLLPVIAFVINSLVGKKLPRQGDWVSILAIIGSFLFSLRIFSDAVFNHYSTDFLIHKTFTWFDLNFGAINFSIDMGVYIDNMTAIMLLMVSGIATLIHVFSTWYMHDDDRYGRFFTFLSLFTSGMLGFVLADNLLMAFMFWELMGFCSYSLIGHYVQKEKAGVASLKAFMITRVGDVILLLGIMAIWKVVGSSGYADIYAALAQGKFEGQQVLGIGLATFAGFCIFCGTIGKSAQFPLQVWLPDAMMGPTPCSALIHAATMVAAGVFLSLRAYPILVAGNLEVFVAYIGAITALMAATMALVQSDIKAVLAYSTVSQLGFMVLGIGVGSYNAAFMHLITHAFFKACLFLSAGSVIHAVHTQEMPQMGGLRKKLPITFMAMLLCTFAISGVPLLSGFVSKDRILGDALYWGQFNGSAKFMIPGIIGFFTAFLTAFYMFRMMFLTFFGKARDHEVYDHCHKEHFEWNRSLPLIILSVFTLGLFYCGSLAGLGKFKIFPESKYEWFKVLVEAPAVDKFVDLKSNSMWESTTKEFTKSSYTHQPGYFGKIDEEKFHHAHSEGAVLSIIIAAVGISLSALVYLFGLIRPQVFTSLFKPLYILFRNKYYMDHFYMDTVLSANKSVYKGSKFFDNFVIDLAVDFTGKLVRLFGALMNQVQSGRIQNYLIVMIVATVVLMLFV